jgi:hypothetical protein
MDADLLSSLDEQGYSPLLALAYGRAPKNPSYAYPHAFVCSDGRTYWVKRFRYGSQPGAAEPGAQEGLIAELVAGRLGAALGAAAAAQVIEVPSAVLLPDGSTAHLEGIGVGSADQSAMENLRYLGQQVPGGALQPDRLNEQSVARVIAFQSWIGADDTQIMVDLRTGHVLSVDHGAYNAFSSSDPQPVVAPGLPPDFAQSASIIEPEIQRIEALSDEEVLRATAQMPDAPEWRADSSRRLTLAESLALRRDRLRHALGQWMT